MSAISPAEDSAATLIERRWFAAARAAEQIRAECDALARVREMAEEAWRRARSKLSHLEAMCEALGEELAAIEERPAGGLRPRALQSSAA
jgi:chromosome segregation ATPase